MNHSLVDHECQWVHWIPGIYNQILAPRRDQCHSFAKVVALAQEPGLESGTKGAWQLVSTTEDPNRVSPAVEEAPVPRSGDVQRLKVGAIGLFGVLFMALANAAPITAMSGNVPIAVGFGNGIGAPGGYLFATVVLVLFTIGFVEMAKHVTTTGAFFGFISHGLGQVWGMAAGFIATMAYIVFEGSLIGIFSYFGNSTLNSWFGWNINWFVLAVICIAVVGVLGYYDINIAAAVLGFFLICEVLLLGALAVSVLFHGGGHDGLVAQSINPVNGFKNLGEGGSAPGVSGSLGLKGADGAVLPAGAAAIGLFFAFWSWIGFETTAVYGEESRNPKKIIPQATLIAVVGLGLFYTFVSWMVISGNGISQTLTLAATNPLQMFEGVFHQFLGEWAVRVFQFLVVTGSFACALAFHNAASRYIYALGREAPSLKKTLGASHPHHGSPHIASLVQSVITLLITLAFFAVKGSDATSAAYVYEYGILAVLGTMAILIVQALTSVGVIWYFHVKKVHPGNGITTGVIPAIGALGMVYVVYLLFSNLSFAGGGASGSPLFKAIPYIVGLVFLAGLGIALWIRSRDPEQYAEIGRTVLEEAHERD
ncbi:MAG: hypothetical protein QOH56_1464 [Pseudonocardiales bacterium]|jgi:amino acid transporter|nr:hypothetical protein [Pseudonocardiales bacterium]MDQ1735213.1 hypothetical protein [Pseudonocardiales bacterium]